MQGLCTWMRIFLRPRLPLLFTLVPVVVVGMWVLMGKGIACFQFLVSLVLVGSCLPLVCSVLCVADYSCGVNWDSQSRLFVDVVTVGVGFIDSVVAWLGDYRAVIPYTLLFFCIYASLSDVSMP